MNTHTTPVTLTEDQRLTLSNSLRVAASHFDNNAELLRRDRTGEWEELAVQFTRQSGESRELAEQIENAEYVHIGTAVPTQRACNNAMCALAGHHVASCRAGVSA